MIEEVSRDHPHVCNCCGEEITGSYGDNSMGKAMLTIAVGENIISSLVPTRSSMNLAVQPEKKHYQTRK